MKYGIITTGSRGDVQPFVSLALGLMRQGHDVTILAPQNFKDFVEGFNVKCIPLTGNTEEIIQSPQALKLLRGGNILKFFYHLQKVAKKSVTQSNLDILEGCKEMDCLISSVLPFPIVYSIGEKYHKKCAVVFLSMPGIPTKEFPHPFFSSFNFSWFNKFSYKVVLLGWLMIKERTNKFRETLNLPLNNIWNSYLNSNTLTLFPMSKELITQPKDWPSNTHVTGFFNLPEKMRDGHIMDKLPHGFKEWLSNGETPIYIGFGSIPIPDPVLFCKVLNDLLATPNTRIIFCTGWSVIPNLPSNPKLFVAKYINHDWLLPKCSTAIIHGGIGTICTVMRSKIPMIVLSVLADQPHNGKLIADKNIGVHIPFKELTTKKLLHAITITQSRLMIEKCIEAGNKVNNEDGVGYAVELIEKYFS